MCSLSRQLSESMHIVQAGLSPQAGFIVQSDSMVSVVSDRIFILDVLFSYDCECGRLVVRIVVLDFSVDGRTAVWLHAASWQRPSNVTRSQSVLTLAGKAEGRLYVYLNFKSVVLKFETDENLRSPLTVAGKRPPLFVLKKYLEVSGRSTSCKCPPRRFDAELAAPNILLDNSAR